LPANLVALPAEAPVMWLGMLAAAAGQLPSAPVESLSWAAGALAGYIAQVAHWFGAPEWAQAEVGLDRPAALIGVYVALAAAVAIALRVLGRRRGLGVGRWRGLALAAGLLVALALVAPRLAADEHVASPAGLRLTVLDVGQGDSILLEPPGAAPVLIDAGPADAGVADELAARGIARLGALVITHPQADHDGGAAAILERLPTDRLVFARARSSTIQAARASGADLVRVAAGARLGLGALRLDVLWPPRERLSARDDARADPNLVALVLVARWHEFDALLTADAEAEEAPVEPGDVEVLKVAHHGSADAGLSALLRRVEPQLALISVGSDNPYGHPAPSTLASVAAEHVPLLRTDHDGSITIDVADHGWTVR
jgi:competence protein ComEC